MQGKHAGTCMVRKGHLGYLDGSKHLGSVVGERAEEGQAQGGQILWQMRAGHSAAPPSQLLLQANQTVQVLIDFTTAGLPEWRKAAGQKYNRQKPIRIRANSSVLSRVAACAWT